MTTSTKPVACALSAVAACLLLQGCALSHSDRAADQARDAVHARFEAYRGRVERAAAGAEPLSSAISAADAVYGDARQDPFRGTVMLYATGQSGGGDFAAFIGAVGCVHLEVSSGGKPKWHDADCPDDIPDPPGLPTPTIEVDLP